MQHSIFFYISLRYLTFIAIIRSNPWGRDLPLSIMRNANTNLTLLASSFLPMTIYSLNLKRREIFNFLF